PLCTREEVRQDRGDEECHDRRGPDALHRPGQVRVPHLRQAPQPGRQEPEEPGPETNDDGDDHEFCPHASSIVACPPRAIPASAPATIPARIPEVPLTARATTVQTTPAVATTGTCL